MKPPLPTIPVLADTREQRPWEFDPTAFTVTRAALPTGDYGLLGAEGVYGIERKSAPDMAASLTTNHDRFMREMERAKTFASFAIICEGGWSDVSACSRYTPEALRGAVVSIWTERGVPIFFCPGRVGAVGLAGAMLRRWWGMLRAGIVEQDADEDDGNADGYGVGRFQEGGGA